MPPSDENMPDFDNMSPEEIQAWMETLAERQGAHEGFTTEERMDIEELDPNEVEVEDNYIPYGKTAEEWEEIKKREQAEREARRQERESRGQQQGSTESQPAASQSQTEEQAPEDQPAAESQEGQPAASSEEQPDFDSMSPEELQAWIETLAERQGADEGFTTEERMDVDELDPNEVDVEDNYVPYGKTAEEWEEIKKREQADRDARRQRQQTSEESDSETEEQEEQASFELPGIDEDTNEESPAEPQDMDWLAGLAQGVGDDSDDDDDFPEMDLSSLGEDINLDNLGSDLDLEALDLGDLGDQETDPMEWLDDLVNDQTQGAAPVDETTGSDEPQQTGKAPSGSWQSAQSDEDPMEWLESLARREGVNEEEFTTGASYDLTREDEEQEAEQPTEEEDYASVDELDQPSVNTEDPVSWLESLAESRSGSTYGADDTEADEDETPVDEAETDDSGEEVSTEDVIADLEQGKTDPEKMRSWMEDMLEQGASRTDVPDYIDEDEDQLAQANIPDWLLEQVGSPPQVDQSNDQEETEDTRSEEEIAAELGFDDSGSLNEEEMPDWLMSDVIDLETDQDDTGEADDATQTAASEEPPATDDMPDWLKEEIDEEDEPQATEAADIPDWLQEDVEDTSAEADLQNIFADTNDTPSLADLQAVDDMEDIDTSDSWVEAFELERKMQEQGLDEIPEAWLESGIPNDLSTAQPSAATTDETASEPSAGTANTLEPEPDLPHGEPEALPDWLAEVSAETEAAEEQAPFTDASEWQQDDESELPDWLQEQQAEYEGQAGDMPDWLSEVGAETTDDVPGWLLDTVTDESETPATTDETPEAEPTPTVSEGELIPSPQVPASMNELDPWRMILQARELVEQDNVDTALEHYEAVVRVNANLDTVVSDLSSLIEQPKHKANAAAYRVLGDSLMRQGKLQKALDTYRQALNLL